MQRFLSILALWLASGAAVSAGDGAVRNDATIETVTSADIMHEDFEGSWPPEGWTILHLGDTHAWEPTGALTQEGETAAWIEFGPAGTNQDEWLVSGPIDLSGVSQATFEFYEDGAYWDSWGDRHYIMVSATSQTDVSSFVTALDMRPGIHTQQSFGGDPVRADISAFAGEPEVYVAFRYTGSYADHWFVDECRVYEPFLHDVAMLTLRPDDQHLDDGDTVGASVVIANRGAVVENNVSLRLELRESGSLFRSDTIPSLSLAPGQILFRSFPPFTVSAGHWYEMTASTFVPGDGNPGNDSLSTVVDTYTHTRAPLGVLLTNNHSTACVASELALDAFMISQNDEASLIRVHGRLPVPDAVYEAAPAANGFLVRSLGAATRPHFRIDGVIDAGIDPGEYDNAFEIRKAAGSPMTMALAWDPSLMQALVSVNITDPVPADAGLRLRVAVTEDAVDELGANGLRYHDQSLRGLYPDTTGTVVPTAAGEYRFAVPCPLDPVWDVARLRATAWVQNDLDGRVQQSVSHALADVPITVGTVGSGPPPPTLSPPAPNPFNPSTRLTLTLGEAGRARVAVYDLGGRLVRTLLDEPLRAGRHIIAWDGRDQRGREAGSGSYLCRVATPQGSDSRRLTLVR